MTTIALFNAVIGAGPARLTIAIIRNFNSPDDAFIITLGNDDWPLTVEHAERLTACGRRIEGALDWSAQHNEPVKLEPYFQRQLGFSDGSAAKFEVGIDELNGLACAYVEWKGKRAIDGSGRLLKMLQVLGEAAATIRQAEASRRVQDIRINPHTFRSPIGWDGRAPWET
jgi:hypothetical protein